MSIIKKYFGFLRKDRPLAAVTETVSLCANKKSVWMIKTLCSEYPSWQEKIGGSRPMLVVEQIPIVNDAPAHNQATVEFTVIATEEDISFMLLSTKIISAVLVRHHND